MLQYIDHVELGNGSSIITRYLNNLTPISENIMKELGSLSDSISINGSAVSNKSEIIDKSMKNIEKTVTNTLLVFDQRIDMYFKAADSAHELAVSMLGENNHEF
jgi:hypothetical protein